MTVILWVYQQSWIPSNDQINDAYQGITAVENVNMIQGKFMEKQFLSSLNKRCHDIRQNDNQ
jgi:hypothetical protein